MDLVPSLKKLALESIRKLPEPLTKELVEEGISKDLGVSIHCDGTYYYIKYVPCVDAFYLTCPKRFKERGLLLPRVESIVMFFKRKTQSRHTQLHVLGTGEFVSSEDLYDALMFIKAEVV